MKSRYVWMNVKVSSRRPEKRDVNTSTSCSKERGCEPRSIFQRSLLANRWMRSASRKTSCLSGDASELGYQQAKLRVREMMRDVCAQRVVEGGLVEGERGRACNDAVDLSVLLAEPVELSLVRVERHVLHVRRKQPVEGAGTGSYVEQRAGTELAEDRGEPTPKPLQSGGSLHRVVENRVAEDALGERAHTRLGFSHSCAPSSNDDAAPRASRMSRLRGSRRRSSVGCWCRIRRVAVPWRDRWFFHLNYFSSRAS